MMADYAVKIKSIPDHSTASTLEDCWQDHYAECPTGRESFYIKVRKVLGEAQIHVIPPAPPTEAPWLQLASTGTAADENTRLHHGLMARELGLQRNRRILPRAISSSRIQDQIPNPTVL